MCPECVSTSISLHMVRDFTSLGGTGILVLIVMTVGGYLFMLKRYKRLIVLLTAVIGSNLSHPGRPFSPNSNTISPQSVFYLSVGFDHVHCGL